MVSKRLLWALWTWPWVNKGQKINKVKTVPRDILCKGNSVQYQAPLISICIVLLGRLLVKSSSEVRVTSSEQHLRHVILQVHLLRSGEAPTMCILVSESCIDSVGIIQHELLDSVLLSRTGVAQSMKLLEKQECHKRAPEESGHAEGSKG